MLRSGSRGYDHDRYIARLWVLAQMGHQFITIGARHFEIGHHQVTTSLRDDLQGLQSIGSQFYAVASFLQHAANKLADADGVIDQDHNFFIGHNIDGFEGNGPAGHGLGSGSEDPGGIGAGHQRTMLNGFADYQPVYVDQENQAAIRSNSG